MCGRNNNNPISIAVASSAVGVARTCDESGGGVNWSGDVTWRGRGRQEGNVCVGSVCVITGRERSCNGLRFNGTRFASCQCILQ